MYSIPIIIIIVNCFCVPLIDIFLSGHYLGLTYLLQHLKCIHKLQNNKIKIFNSLINRYSQCENNNNASLMMFQFDTSSDQVH